MSVFQLRLFASPHSGLRPWLMCVICFHWPVGPAHTSGGLANDCSTTADVFPSRESDAPTPNPLAAILSGPVQTLEIAPDSRFTSAIPLPPSTISPNRIAFESAAHSSVAADAFIP